MELNTRSWNRIGNSGDSYHNEGSTPIAPSDLHLNIEHYPDFLRKKKVK